MLLLLLWLLFFLTQSSSALNVHNSTPSLIAYSKDGHPTVIEGAHRTYSFFEMEVNISVQVSTTSIVWCYKT